jgi:hypothetical protein
LISNKNFDDPRFARFQGLSTSIGRFSAYATPDRRSASLQKNTVSIQLRHFPGHNGALRLQGRLMAIVALLTGLLGG